MSSPVVISVEKLGKLYRINRQAERRSYVALRDVLTDKIQGLFRRRSSSGLESSMEDFWALEDVSFEVKQGEVIGVIGRNGAGKSTLLKVLSRITEPSRGRVRIKGRVASLLEVGTGFHPELTGRENIFLNGAILGMRRAEIRSKFDEIVAFAEVEKFLDTPVKRYSSGMYVRLAFAVAAHLEPEILIVDEVLAVGDSAFQKKCLGKMRDVGQSGRTVLFVSHSMEALVRLCSKCIFLTKGRVEMEGETRPVIAAYSSSFKQSEGEIDLTKLPRRFEGNGNAKLLRLRSLGGEGDTGSWCYEYGSSLGFSLEFEVFRTLEEPEIGYSVFSNTGTELLSATTFQECPMERLHPGQYRMNVRIPGLTLNPGVYILALGIASAGRSVDHILEASQIEIIPTDHAIQKGLDKIWAPFTARTNFELVPLV